MNAEMCPQERMNRAILKWLWRLGGALALYFVVWLLTRLGVSDWIREPLLWGWMSYAEEALPRVRVDGAAVLTGVLCFAGLLVAVQVFGGFVYAAVTERRGARQVWRWRWSGLCVAGVVLLFVAGLAGVGLIQNGYAFGLSRERFQSELRNEEHPEFMANFWRYFTHYRTEDEAAQMSFQEAQELAAQLTCRSRGLGQIQAVPDAEGQFAGFALLHRVSKQSRVFIYCVPAYSGPHPEKVASVEEIFEFYKRRTVAELKAQRKQAGWHER